MSKKTQILKDFAAANLCAYSIRISSVNLISVYGGFKAMDFRIAPKQLKLVSGSLFNKSEKQAFINAWVKSAKFKNINKAFQFLSFNTGLVFVLIAFYGLNASIGSL